MKKIAVIDIETTGINSKTDLVVEIAIVEVEFKKKRIKEIFNKLILESNFNDSFQNACIFEKDYINYKQYKKGAVPLRKVRRKIQKILDSHKITSYNIDLNFAFLRDRGFIIRSEFPCLMKASTPIVKEIHEDGTYKYPSLKNAWKFFHKDKKFEDGHRALNDAKNAAQILLKLYREFHVYEYRFSKELERIYSDYTKNIRRKKEYRKKYVHGPETEEEALDYLSYLFPLHYTKIRHLIKEKNVLNFGCGKILILDIGCGPLTFTLGLLDELYYNSSKFMGGIYDIQIYGIDRSSYILDIGKKVLSDYISRINKASWTFQTNFSLDNSNFDDINDQLSNWIHPEFDHIIIGYSCSMSSGVNNLADLLNSIVPLIGDNTHLHCFITEPMKYSHNVKIKKLRKRIHKLTIIEEKMISTCKKPKGFISDHKFISTIFKCIYINNSDVSIRKVLKEAEIVTSPKQYFSFFHKTKKWLLGQSLFDTIGFSLYEYDKYLTRSIILENYPYHKSSNFLKYKIQKKLYHDQNREIFLLDIFVSYLSTVFLMSLGQKIDEKLLDDVVLGCRLTYGKKLDQFYEYFTVGYTKFINFEKSYFNNQFYLFQVDINRYYNSIKKSNLRERISSLCRRNHLNNQLANNWINLLGNQPGIPIGSQLSPISANFYLESFDKNIYNKREVIGYVRYMDDLKLIIRKNSYEKIKTYLDASLNEIDLKLNTDKMIFKKIESDPNKSEYSNRFQDYSESLLELIRPIMFSLILFLEENIENFRMNKNDIYALCGKLSIAYRKNGVYFEERDLVRYVYLIINNLQFAEFKKEVQKIVKEKECEILIPRNILEISNDRMANEFNSINLKWIEKVTNFTKNIYLDLKTEIIKCEGFISNIKDDLNIRDDVGEISNENIQFFELITKNKDFIQSMRMIKYLMFRLTKFLYKELENPYNEIIQGVNKLAAYFLPISIVSLFLNRYQFIDSLKYFLEKYLEEKQSSEDIVMREVYSCDIAFIIHLLTKYYFENPVVLQQDWDYWNKKINFILNYRQNFEERLAITSFILKLNLIKQFSSQEYLSWIGNETNVLILRNLILCLIPNPEFQNSIPKVVQQKIIEHNKKDRVGITLLLRFWSSYRATSKNIDFNKQMQYHDIGYYSLIFDLENELMNIFEWDEGFGTFFIS